MLTVELLEEALDLAHAPVTKFATTGLKAAPAALAPSKARNGCSLIRRSRRANSSKKF